jgi:hypothetical protein
MKTATRESCAQPSQDGANDNSIESVTCPWVDRNVHGEVRHSVHRMGQGNARARSRVTDPFALEQLTTQKATS